MQCKICMKEATEEYCKLHEKACSNLIEKFEKWKEALGLSWRDYLKAVSQNPFTGTMAREVAEALLSKNP